MKKGEKMDNARLGILDEKLENLATQSIRLSLSADLVKSGEGYRFGRGLYVVSSMLEDDFYLLQQKYGRGIYLHGYSDRTPAKYTMTFLQRYNARSLKLEKIMDAIMV